MKLLPDSIKHFIVNRLLEISGITAILLSLFILISVASYSSFDPSALNLNNHEIKKLGWKPKKSTYHILKDIIFEK